MSFFNPQGIPEWILRKSRRTFIEQADGRWSNHDEDDEDGDSEFNEDLDILRAYSLISLTAENKTYEMHSLVQFCMRAWLSSFNEVDHWHHRFVVLMAQELLSMDYYEDWVKFRQLFIHIEPLFDSTPTKETRTAWEEVMCKSVLYFLKSGRCNTAQQIAEKALSVIESALGFDDKLTLKAARTLMQVLHIRGHRREEEKIGWRVLQACEELGKQDFSTLSIIGDLAIVMRKQGRYEESEKLVRRIMEAHKEERDPFRIKKLAIILRDLGRLEEAEKLFSEAIEGCKEELGERHIDTLLLTSNLGTVLARQGQCWPGRVSG